MMTRPKKNYPDNYGTINLKIDPVIKKKYFALLTLEGKTMQGRIVELIEKDVEAKLARQQKAE